MRRVLLGVAAFVLGLTLTGAAQAHPGGHGPSGSGHYYHTHGRAFRGGYYYPGHHHNHWSHRVWDATYGRYHYWDPYLHCYYYWYAPHDCYYPITYCP